MKLLSRALPLVLLSSVVLAGGEARAEVAVLNLNITTDEVVAAQNGWCSALLAISQTYAKHGFAAAKDKAEAVIDQAYGYVYGPVAFKPTLASGRATFRPTREGALSYFVGGNPRFPADKGFALKPWVSCTVDNEVMQLGGPNATTMGHVSFTDRSGKVTTVDKTWRFLRASDGSVRIMLHHSSLPYSD